jgi:hypothetical protein
MPRKNWVRIIDFPKRIQIELSPHPQKITACCPSLLKRYEKRLICEILPQAHKFLWLPKEKRFTYSKKLSNF